MEPGVALHSIARLCVIFQNINVLARGMNTLYCFFQWASKHLYLGLNQGALESKSFASVCSALISCKEQSVTMKFTASLAKTGSVTLVLSIDILRIWSTNFPNLQLLKSDKGRTLTCLIPGFTGTNPSHGQFQNTGWSNLIPLQESHGVAGGPECLVIHWIKCLLKTYIVVKHPFWNSLELHLYINYLDVVTHYSTMCEAYCSGTCNPSNWLWIFMSCRRVGNLPLMLSSVVPQEVL